MLIQKYCEKYQASTIFFFLNNSNQQQQQQQKSILSKTDV